MPAPTHHYDTQGERDASIARNLRIAAHSIRFEAVHKMPVYGHLTHDQERDLDEGRDQ